MSKLPKHFIIPDAHVHPGYSNKRFKALGRLIAEERPDTIICIGDFADMPSLCSYDYGKKAFEGRRYHKDIDAALDAQEKLFNQLAKVRGYEPRLILTLGNHEYRIERAVEDDPKLENVLGIKDLQYEKYGWEVYPFQQVVTLDGISYCHYFVSGIASRPISGENIGKSLCNKLHASSVQGHSHVFDHSERAIINGTKIFGLSCGCFVHPDMIENWNRATVAMWWRGVVILDDLDRDGYYDQLRAITLRKIMRDFR